MSSNKNDNGRSLSAGPLHHCFSFQIKDVGMPSCLGLEESQCPWLWGRICCIIMLPWGNSNEPHTTLCNFSKTPLNTICSRKLPELVSTNNCQDNREHGRERQMVQFNNWKVISVALNLVWPRDFSPCYPNPGQGQSTCLEPTWNSPLIQSQKTQQFPIFNTSNFYTLNSLMQAYPKDPWEFNHHSHRECCLSLF